MPHAPFTISLALNHFFLFASYLNPQKHVLPTLQIYAKSFQSYSVSSNLVVIQLIDNYYLKYLLQISGVS